MMRKALVSQFCHIHNLSGVKRILPHYKKSKETYNINNRNFFKFTPLRMYVIANISISARASLL